MKAKELAQLYKDTPTTFTLAVICDKLIREIYDIAKARRVDDRGIPAILDEQERKWKAVVNQLSILEQRYDDPHTMFALALESAMPEVYSFWKAPKKGRS